MGEDGSETVAGRRVLVVGDVMRDVLVRPEGPLRRGSDRKADIEIRPGGAGANQAVWLAACGVSPFLVARVGRSDLKDLEAQFCSRGVRPCFAADGNRSSGVLVSMIESDGERSFYTDRGANENLASADLPVGILERVDLVLLSGYSFFAPGPRKLARELMAAAKKSGVPVAIDPASSGFIRDVGVQRFLDWTGGAAFLFPNSDEAGLLSGADTPQEQIRWLGAHYGRVIVKQGSGGASALDEEGVLVHAGARRVRVVDSTGAGDAFVAGFLSGILRGEDLRACLERGNRQGARAVSRMGGQPEFFFEPDEPDGPEKIGGQGEC